MTVQELQQLFIILDVKQIWQTATNKRNIVTQDKSVPSTSGMNLNTVTEVR